jgi:four helix bundle protein
LRFDVVSDVSKAELLTRTKAFALRILKLVDHLPRTTSGRAIGNQLVRSGTSVGANYRAACRSRSRAEFAAKLGLVAEEADETVYWLEVIRDGNLLAANELSRLLKEADELTAIFTSGRRSSSGNQTSNLKHECRFCWSRSNGREHGAPIERSTT